MRGLLRYGRWVMWVALLLLPSAACAADDIVVIVHRDNGIQALSRPQLIDVYMGRLRRLADDRPVVPFDYPADAAIKTEFYRLLAGRSLAQINAYWARLLFNGSAAPPRQLGNASEVVATVAGNRLAIGYVYANEVTDSVKIVARLSADP